MSKRVSGCLLALVCGIAISLLVLGGALDISVQLHIPPSFLRRNPAPYDTILNVEVKSKQEDHFLGPSDEVQTHRKLQGLQLSHSRQPKYSIYTGVDKAARDMAQMQRSTQQIERALERVKVIQRGSGTLALESLLNNYKARHVECLHSKELPRKYIVVEMWDEYAGLGNQFPSIITGLLMALLTERCLFINFPFYHKAFASELDFDWGRHQQRLLSFGHDVTKTPPYAIQFWKGEDLTSWLMKDQKALYDQHYGIHLKNDPDYSAALFQANPHHAPFLSAVFPTGEMFQPLARFMLKVKPELEDQVQDFKRKYFRPFTVGLQIRRLKCDGGQGSIHCDELPQIENFVAVARSLQRSKGIPDSEFRVFVGADMVESYQKVVGLMGQDMVIYRYDNGVGTVKSKVIGVHNPGTPESALIDMRLLSECNELVVTVGSSYGSISAGIGGIAPVQMLHGLHKNVQNPYWYKALTSEPCYWKGNIFLNNKDPFWGKLGTAEIQQFKSNPFWMQYTQCHCAT